ncbi:ventral anterior homeobox 1-like [Amphibalanus amphitrite]|uniref:ventral anterior homeobox 1-like n=1 Tax=Amphibalanus amphitrite TaxID=1232801 RepID=UPI001C924782|nr:ventral anterior homeobox 1-like [Amphibalanus amphitrite]
MMSSAAEPTVTDSTQVCKDLPDYVQTMEVTDASGRRRQLVFPKGLDLDRPKRSRTSFSGEQLRQLERSYRASPYLVGGERRRLADSLGLSETQIKVWYQNRRTKNKKQKESEPLGADRLAAAPSTWCLPAGPPRRPVLPPVSAASTVGVRAYHEVAAVATPRPLRPEVWQAAAGPTPCYRPPLWPFHLHQTDRLPFLPHVQYKWA